MTATSEKPRRSLLARIISIEGAMAAFGLYSLVSGLRSGEVLQIFWGIMILGGLCLLIAVRRRDWKRHWEEMETLSANRSQSPPPEQTDTTPTEK
jgi:hypothetical protein